MLHFPYTVTVTSAYFLQFCFGISIQLQRANLRLCWQKMKYCAVDAKMWLCRDKNGFSIHNIKLNLWNFFYRQLQMDQGLCHFERFYCKEWGHSYPINRSMSVMEAHSCHIGQNILLCQSPSCITHLHLVPAVTQESPESKNFVILGMTLQLAEKTLNFLCVLPG